MSKLQEKTSIIKKRKRSSLRNADLLYPSSVGIAKDVPKKKKRYPSQIELKSSRKKKNELLFYGIGCITIGVAIGLFSSLLGHTLLEQTRRGQIRIKEKITSFKSEITFLKNKVEDVKYHESIDRWAESKGMVNDSSNQPKTEGTINTSTNEVLKDAYIASF